MKNFLNGVSSSNTPVPRSDISKHGLSSSAEHDLRNFRRSAIALAVAGAFVPWIARAMPAGNQVVSGNVSVSMANASTMIVSQTSNKAIVNWNSFSVGAGETVNFQQPGAGSMILNRVTGIDYSAIFGSIKSNGLVYLINPAGIRIGNTARIDGQGFVASSLGITDGNFLAGRLTFEGTSSAGAVVNQGEIRVGGIAALLAPRVRNEGLIVARLGTVGLGAGERVTLDMLGDGLMKLSVDAAALNANITNSGTIAAEGGSVLLTARAANALVDTVINMDGVIRATSIVERNGIIVLDGGGSGVVKVSGTIDASGKGAGEAGGTVKILGDKVGLFDAARVDVSGDVGGGTAFIGGNFHGAGLEQNASSTYVSRDATVNADAITFGNGGSVAVWSNNGTHYFGTITARGGAAGGNGGFVEVSGKHYLAYEGAVDLSARTGTTGTLLLDPDDITISHGAANSTTSDTVSGNDPFTDSNSTATPSEIADATLNNQLANANVTVQTSQGGSITSNTDVAITLNGKTLTLNSAKDISLNGSFTGTGTLNLFIGQGGTGAAITVAAATFVPDATVNVTGNAGKTNQIINVSRAADFTLSDTQLSSTSGFTMNLTNIGLANLVGTGANRNFTITGWSGGGSIDNTGFSGTVTSADARTYYKFGATKGNFATAVPGGTMTATAIQNIMQSGEAIVDMSGAGATGGLNGNLTTVGGRTILGAGNNVGGNVNVGTGTLIMGTAGGVTGDVTAGTLDYSNYKSDVTFVLGGNPGSTGIGGYTKSVASIVGNAAYSNTIRGQRSTYLLDDATADSGSIADINGYGVTQTWKAFQNIYDASGGKVKFGKSGSVTGNLTSYDTGTLDYSTYTADVTYLTWNNNTKLAAHSITVPGIGGATMTLTTTGIGGTNTNFTAIHGNSNAHNTIVDTNGGGGQGWDGFQNYTLTQKATVRISPNYWVTGNLTLLAGGTLDYSNYNLAISYTLGSVTGVPGVGGKVIGVVNSVIANSFRNNTLIGVDATYTLDDQKTNTGTAVWDSGRNGPLSWSGFRNITDNGAATVNFGTNSYLSGNLTSANSGTLNYSKINYDMTYVLGGDTGSSGIGGTNSGFATIIGNGRLGSEIDGGNATYVLDNAIANKGSSNGQTWTNFKNIHDSGAANVKFGTGGSVTGKLNSTDAGTLDYSVYATDVNYQLDGSSSTGIGGTNSGFTNVLGNPSRSNTIAGADATYTLNNTTPNAGSAANYGVTWTGFKNIVDSGTAYVNFGTGGSVTGSLTSTTMPAAGTLDYTKYASDVTYILGGGAGSTGIGGTNTGFKSILGNTTHTNTIKRTNADAFTLDPNNPKAGSSNGQSWQDFGNVQTLSNAVNAQPSPFDDVFAALIAAERLKLESVKV